jgi:peroxiredoxin Q/BCP
MKRLLTLLALLLTVVAAPTFAADAAAAAPTGPVVGQTAPDFHLQDQKGEWHTLAQERGKWTVLYFYPKDFTPGCTTEVCTFRDDIIALRKAGADVFGVSLDDVKSHAEFAEKYHVPFRLLSDADQSVAKNYGVLTSKLGMSYARRETFLIDPQGVVAKRYKNVDPKENSKQVLADLAELKKAQG